MANQFSSLLKHKLISNSIWGVVSNLVQNLLFSVFFVVMARVYDKEAFGQYVIANTLYSFMLGFSSLGLGHWFIREVVNQQDKQRITRTFFKVQFLIGLFFYGFNLAISFLLYTDPIIRSLSLIIGINLIFDNIINVIKSLNIAHQEQKKTFALLTIEAALKCLVAIFLLFQKLDLVTLSFLLIILRLVTLNLFIRMGSSSNIGLLEILREKINWHQIKSIVLSNWAFIVISSMSIINWRIGNILVSKWLTLDDVANYEISFKLFSLAYLVPIIVTQSIYPKLLEAIKQGKEQLKEGYHKAYWPLFLYGFAAFSFVYTFADDVLPVLFGEKYQSAAPYCKQMFTVLLIFPTIFLQANVLLALKLEKLDMLCNVISVIINFSICLIGLQWYQDLTVINVAIFSSFFIFHMIQDYILIKQGITEIKHVLGFYVLSISATFLFIAGFQWLSPFWAFTIFWIIAILISIPFLKRWKRIYFPTH
jgi:O-antigen/teichoic acid export membrane protein